MEIKIISKTQQEFCGKVFTKYKGTSYYKGYLWGKRWFLHRAVWAGWNGKIPKGKHIHHKDHNSSNNEPENLELMDAGRHLSEHMTPERRQKQREWIKKIAPLTKKWHSSEEGRAWHRLHGKKAFQTRKPVERDCAHCHTPFLTLQFAKSTRFCHQNCKMKARRRRLRGLPEDFQRSPIT